VAADIGFTAPATCTVFGASETVQSALVKVVQREELRLLGGDGQRLQVPQKVLPQPVRVLVDSICGPVAGVSVVASASSGALVARVTGLQPPPDLASAGGQPTLPTTTGSTGQAAFWWQPAPGVANDSLQVVLQGATGATAVNVTTRAPGRSWIHLTRVMVRQVGPVPDLFLQNDNPLTSQQLLSGIYADTDQPLDTRTVVGKPVCYVELDLPWPVPGESTPLSTSTLVAFRTVRLPSTDTTSTPPVTALRWAPSEAAKTWLGTLNTDKLGTTAIAGPLAGRFVIEGWGVIGTDPSLHLNCHVPVAIEASPAAPNGVPHFQVVDPNAAKPVFVVDDEVVRDRFVLRFNLQH
jgi:hypothetical protein